MHGHLAMVVCVLGTLFNLANILVLTHRDMRNPVNMILTGIAVADCLNNLEYIPFTIHMNFLDTDTRLPEEKVTVIGSSQHFLFVWRRKQRDGWAQSQLFRLGGG